MNNEISQEDENVMDIFFSLKEEERFDEAFEVLSPLKIKYPENFKIYFLLGVVLYELKDFEQAKINLKKAVSLNPTHALSSLVLIHSLASLSEWHTAFNEIRRFIVMNKNNIEEHLLLINELLENKNNFSTSEREAIRKLYINSGKR